MRRNPLTIAIVLAAFVVIGYLARTFDLIGFIWSLHSGGPASH